MSQVQEQLRALAVNRRSCESTAFLLEILHFVVARVQAQRRHLYADLLGAAEAEDVASEVLLDLTTRGLHSFRGETMAELMAYVRTAADRTLRRRARRRLMERQILQRPEAELGSWTRPSLGVERFELEPRHLDLSAADQAWLEALLAAGSQAHYARALGVSRAAVSQRVQRIQQRIAALPEGPRTDVEVWLMHAARKAVYAEVADAPDHAAHLEETAA